MEEPQHEPLRRISKQLNERGIAPDLIGVFHPMNVQLVADIAAMMVGAASIGAMTEAAGPAVDSTLKVFTPSPRNRSDLPHWVVVAVTDETVQVFAGNRHGDLGPQVAEFHKGTFRADFDRILGEIDLTLDSKDQGRMTLKGKQGIFHKGALAVAEAAVELASNA